MKGFDKDALILIAEQCFIKGTKSPEGMNTVVAKFLKEGCLSAEAIRQYLSSLAARDEVVAKVIKTSGSSRNITNNDRDMYALWSIDWGFGDDVIMYAATLAAGKAQAMSYIGNILSRWKSAGAMTLEEAKRMGSVSAKSVEAPNLGRTYTKQELDAYLGDTEDFTDIDL